MFGDEAWLVNEMDTDLWYTLTTTMVASSSCNKNIVSIFYFVFLHILVGRNRAERENDVVEMVEWDR